MSDKWSVYASCSVSLKHNHTLEEVPEKGRFWEGYQRPVYQASIKRSVVRIKSLTRRPWCPILVVEQCIP